MHEVIKTWGIIWSWILGVILLLVLGFPTLGFAWYLLSEMASWGSNWQEHTRPCLILARATENWLHALRNLALILLGFPTFGYTWIWMRKRNDC